MIKVVVLLVTLIGVVMAKPSFYSGGLLIPSSVSNTYRQDIIKLPYPSRSPQILPSTTPTSQPMKPTLPADVVPKPPPTNGTAPALRPYQPPAVVYFVPASQPASPVLLIDCPPVIQYW